MSYFRKSILFFALVFGMFSGSYAAGMCGSTSDHENAFKAKCNGAFPGAQNYANKEQCQIASDSRSSLKLCQKWNPMRSNGIPSDFVGGGYCPPGANGVPCKCKKGTNWKTNSQKCLE